jgi:hypothetical protein
LGLAPLVVRQFGLDRPHWRGAGAGAVLVGGSRPSASVANPSGAAIVDANGERIVARASVTLWAWGAVLPGSIPAE